MNSLRSFVCGVVALCATVICATAALAQESPATRPALPGKADPAVATIRAASAAAAAAFNAGKADDLVAMFLPDGELVDEEGTVYQGEQAIKKLFEAFFKKYPDTKVSFDAASVRITGPVAVEEGTRTMSGKDGSVESRFRYMIVRAKTPGGWKIASLRDFEDEPVLAHGDYLRPLSWMVGEWINQGADGAVSISYKWSEDRNYLLGEFQHTSSLGAVRTTTQRIGWDPTVRKIRVWLFEADGGFAEGYWTVVPDGVIAKYSSVNPDGRTASATIKISPKGKDRFVMLGSDRIVGNAPEANFEIIATRRPPVVSK